MESLFEKKGGTYTLAEDGMYYPDLELPEDEEPHYGKYGKMQLKYLKEHRWGLYSAFLLEDKLTTHLNEIDDVANERMDILLRQMVKQQGITESMKSEDWLGWLGTINNIWHCAKEMILEELIFN